MAGNAAPRGSDRRHFAVIGAGVAGLVCARELLATGGTVVVFERGETVGGRLCGWQTEAGYCDIGAQFLTVQQPLFADEVRRWVSADLLRTWGAEVADLSNGQASIVAPGAPRFVGVPSMQRLAVHLAEGLDIVAGTEVRRIARSGGTWHLFDSQDRHLSVAGFDALVLAMPSGDALQLAQGLTPLAARMERVRWDSCWSASLALSRASGIEFDGAFISDDPILAWAARENSKPMRAMGEGTSERWLLQARSAWSNNFPGLLPDEAARWMQRAFAARLARPLAQKSCVAMRWANATPVDPLVETFLWDEQAGIGFAGDWCGGARIESAFVSGLTLAKAIAG